MSITDGHQALVRRIVTMADPPNIKVPRGPGKDLPRYNIQVSGGTQRTDGTSGVTDARPEIVVKVETKSEYATENEELVADLVARFEIGDQFDGVTVEDAPIVKPPMESTGLYSVPVVIRGRFFF